MTTPSTFLKFQSGDSIEIEARAFDGPLLHIGHDGDTFSRIALTGEEAIGLVGELINSLTRGMNIGVIHTPVARASWRLNTCPHGHALCPVCHVEDRNSVPLEQTYAEACETAMRVFGG